MLQLKNLTIILKEDYRTILEGFNFTLNPGDRVALIGEEGNDKSLLLKSIVNRQGIEEFCEVSGEISLTNEVIGYLPQELSSDMLDLSARDYLHEELHSLALDYGFFYKYLDRFKLDSNLPFSDLQLRSLSGGERIKYVLLVELLKNPTMFLFDEPSNDLDYRSIEWLENFMLDLDVPFIFVSHDTNLLSKVANVIIHIEQIYRRTKPQFTIAKCSYDEYILRREKYIKYETSRSRKEHEEFSKKQERYRRVNSAVESALRSTRNDVEGKDLKDKMQSVKSLGRRLEKEEAKLKQKPDYEEGIDIFFDEKISVPYGKDILKFYLDELKIAGKVLARNIKLTIIGPEKICIIGENGAGKTTLLRMLMEELQILNLKVGYMPQSYFELEDKDIKLLDYLSKTYTQGEHNRISSFLGSLNFKREEMFRKIGDLSGGQKAKAFFCKMILDESEVLVLDEPTRNLSPLSQPEIIDALKSFNGVIIAVSHDKNFIEEVFETVYKLDHNGLQKLR